MHSLLLWFGLAIAGPKSASEAEYDRLVSEMGRLSKTQNWTVVNKRYVELEALGMDIHVNDLLLGAQAAQEVGDIFSAKKRVAAALIKKEKRSTREWYTQLDNEYGHVTLIAKGKGNRTLEQQTMTMDPIKGRAVSYAQQQLESDGEFIGMLPVGAYDFGGEQFVVAAEVSIHLEISPKLRKKLGM